mmetsp:Transcript_102068/g.286921  ORF Transcript_102068/g.286921 Transcript_102068/m.286921 type:complete len:552 (-) Transcript_102068:94-1749(-)
MASFGSSLLLLLFLFHCHTCAAAMGLPPPPPERLFAIMSDGSDALTWGDMASKRDGLAHALAKKLPDSTVAAAVYGKNCVEWVLSYQVIQVLGLRFSPINWHLVGDEIAYIVDDSDADVLFFGAEFATTVAAMRPRLPKVKAFVSMDGVFDGCLSLGGLLAEAPVGARPPEHARKGGTVAYTGGTTGKPKGALRESSGTQQLPQQRIAALKEWGALRMMPHPIHLVSAPMYHALPLAWYLMGSALGSTFVFMKRFDAVAVLEAVERHRINGFYMPPVLLKRLLQVPEQDRRKYDISTVKMIMSGGAACPSSVKEGILEMFGSVLHELYGASELGGVAVMPPEEMLKRPKSCGKIATGYDVIILDENKQRINKPGVAGEIYAKGMNIDKYHKLEAKTEEARLGEYFSVGDVGYLDVDGFLYISDRKIDMVVSGGVNIYPAAVEEILHRHPAIEDVAVFGVPDEDYGERVHAALKLCPGLRLDASELLAWCEGKIGKFQLPREADLSFHAEDFPRSDAGKLRKKALREQILATAAGGGGGGKGGAGAPPKSRL